MTAAAVRARYAQLLQAGRAGVRPSRIRQVLISARHAADVIDATHSHERMRNGVRADP